MARLRDLRHKNNAICHNVIKKACLALFVNRAVGLKIYFIGFQTTYQANISSLQ